MAYIPPYKRNNANKSNNANNANGSSVKDEQGQKHYPVKRALTASIYPDNEEEYEEERQKDYANRRRVQFTNHNNNHNSYNNSYNSNNYNNNRNNEELERLREECKDKSRELNKLTNSYNNLLAENDNLKKQLEFYAGKTPKVSQQEFDMLNEKFENYKAAKYKEFRAIKEKLDNHDKVVNDLNKEIRELEDKLKKSNADVDRYKSSLQDMNKKIKILRDQQAIIKPQQQQPDQQNPTVETAEPPKLENKEFIQDDWDNIMRCLDLVLDLDKKILKSSGLNTASIKLTRSLIKK